MTQGLRDLVPILEEFQPIFVLLGIGCLLIYGVLISYALIRILRLKRKIKRISKNEFIGDGC